MKEIKFLLIVSLGLCLLCLVNSCGDDDDEVKILEVSALDPNFMAYCYFKEGTWWVYEERTTGQLDSQWVTGNVIGSDTAYGHNDPRDPILSHYDMVIRSSFGYTLKSSRNYSYSFGGINCSDHTPDESEDHKYLVAHYFRDSQIYPTQYFVYKPEVGYYINYSREASKIIRITDSFEIGSNDFGYSVAVSIESDPNDWTSNYKELVISKYFGITQFSYKTDSLQTYPSGWQIWDLVRFNIVQ